MRVSSKITILLYMKAKFSLFRELTQRFPGRHHSKAKGPGTVGWPFKIASWSSRLVRSNSQENEQVRQAVVGIPDWAQTRIGSTQKVKIESKNPGRIQKTSMYRGWGRPNLAWNWNWNCHWTALESPILLKDFSLRLPRWLCPEQRLGRKVGK